MFEPQQRSEGLSLCYTSRRSRKTFNLGTDKAGSTGKENLTLGLDTEKPGRIFTFFRIGNQTELSCHRWCQLQEDQFDVDEVIDEDFNLGHSSAVTDADKVSQNLRVHTSHSSLTQNMSSG